MFLKMLTHITVTPYLVLSLHNGGRKEISIISQRLLCFRFKQGLMVSMKDSENSSFELTIYSENLGTLSCDLHSHQKVAELLSTHSQVYTTDHQANMLAQLHQRSANFSVK